jgi:GntR family histidine utilization transcriptional repressor
VSDPAPGLGARFAEHVIQRITTGAWPVGARLPSEAAFGAEFGISRMTVHHALRDLTRRGFLARRKGDGTFVASPSRYASRYDHIDIRDEIRARGGTHRARVLIRELRPASPAEAADFGIDPGTELFHALIAHHEDDRPLEIEDRLINPAALPDSMEIDLSEQSLFGVLMLVRPYREGSETIRAIISDPREQALLALAAPEPCLEIRRRTWTSELVVTSARIVRASARAAISGVIAPGAAA